MAIETKVNNLNFVSTGLTALDFDPCEQGHCVRARLHEGCRVVATIANSKHQGGVAVAWRVESTKGQAKPNQDIESFQQHGPNCMSCHCLHGGKRQPVTAACLPPDALEDLHHVQAASDRFKNRCPPTSMADLNVDLCVPAPDLRTRQVADFLAANGMEDMLQHFHFRRRFRHQKTWCQKRCNPDGTIQTVLRSRTDCVMTSPALCHCFKNVQLVDPRMHRSDHCVKCRYRYQQKQHGYE